MLKEIDVSKIKNAVKFLCIDANKSLPSSVVSAVCNACERETHELGKEILRDIKSNIECAKSLNIPVCQDTGITVVFLEIGQDVHLVGGSLTDAVNQGVREGYEEGLLRKSVVADPLNRNNTNDNTPAIIHTKIVDGDCVKITVAPKGAGSENMSDIRMLTPSVGRQGVIDAVLDIVKNAGSNPCPPMIIGVGIGGDFEQCAILSKIALCRDLNVRNENLYYKNLEDELLAKINELNIGPQGFGGNTTALSVNIEYAPTHIASLPVAVNVGCYVTRHKTEIIK